MATIDPNNAATYTGAALAAAEATLDASLAGASLAQAQAAKTVFAVAVFNALRQAPIAYTVTAGAYTWDAADEAVNALTLALLVNLISGVGGADTGLVAQINTAFANLVSDTNTALSNLTTDTDNIVNDVVSDTNTVFSNLVSQANNAILQLDSGSSAATISGIGSVNPENVRSESVRSEGVSVNSALGTLAWPPYGASSTVTLQGSDAAGLIGAIASRRATLKQTQLTLDAEIAACSTAAAVIALSVSGASW